MTSLVTPGYAPFEQYHDADGKQGPWTDIYSLGATCYCMLTGKPPIDALKRGMARIDHSTDAYLPLVDLRLGDYSEHVLQAIDHALEFKESDRPQNVRDLSAMLRGDMPVPQSSVPTRLGDAVIDPGGDTQVVTAPGEATQVSNTAPQAVTAPDAPTVTAPPRQAEPAAEAPRAAPSAAPPAAKKSGSRSVGIIIAAIVALLVALGVYTQLQRSDDVAQARALYARYVGM
jgi:serine/threonine protein kinase